MKRALACLAVSLLLAPAARAYDILHFLPPIAGSDKFKPAAAASSGERLYVLDSRRSVLFIYDADGKLVKSVEGSGDKAGRFREPRGVAVGPSGAVYVADTGNSRIQIFDRDGNPQGAFGEDGAAPGRLSSPESVAVGADGRVFVADTGNDRVQVFTAEGILLYQIGTAGEHSGQMRAPSRIAVDPSDALYVLERGNDRIQKFGASAKPITVMTLKGNDMAVDPYGFIYVLDGSGGKVIEETPEGVELGRFGSYGSGSGQIKKAEGIAVAPDGTIIVLDTGNSRIQRVELTNKLKTAAIPPNSAAKMLLSGPVLTAPMTASALAADGDDLFAYLPQGGPFVVLGPDGKEKSRFGAAKGKGGDVTRGAGGLAVSGKLGVFASDTPDDRLQRFSRAGQWQANIGEAQGWMDDKKKDGRVRAPGGVAINDEGTVYVADAGNRRVDAFSPDGVFEFSIGPKVGTYELIEPAALAWDKAGFLFIADKGLKRVIKCAPSGAFVAAWGSEGDGRGQFKAPVALAFDGQNYLYVLDSELKRVSVYARDGQWLNDFFSGGKQDHELLEPAALAVSGQRLVIADKFRLLSFDLHPRLAPPVGISSSTKDGVVSLAWRPAADAWAAGYQVFRSSRPGGPFAAAGAPKEEKFPDAGLASNARYWYRVATVSKTGDVGPASAPLETFLPPPLETLNRAPVEISTVTLGKIFAANYKWYLKNPVGKVTIASNADVPFQNVKVTFKLKDYMDFGFDTEIKRLEPRQSVDIPLIATLNNKVLEVTEDTPIQAEFALGYYESGEARTATLTKPLRLYSRNAITWDDARKIANFITLKDGPVKDFKPAVTAAFKNRKAAALNPNVLKALRLWNALGEYGVRFAANPSNPFETAHDDPNFPVDYTQYPRETLKRKTGQCSDMTSLYAALLEDNEVHVALLDYPGHITLMLDTEADDAVEAGLPADLLVERGGTMWLPVEVTYVGKPFYEAVSKAAYAYKAEAEKGRVKVIDVDKAFEEYEPVTMPPTDFSPSVPDAAALGKLYDDQVGVLAKERNSFLRKHYADELGKDPKNADAQLQLGLVELQFEGRKEAAAAFSKVLELDPKNAAALNDLGGVAFLDGDFALAEQDFLKAADADASDGDIWLNLAKTAAKLKKADKAREYGDKAVALSPGYKPFVDNLVNGL